MSWLSIPLPNPFKTLESDSSHPPQSPPLSPSHGGGVKEDLSVLGQTIGRQLRGVAAFLAPPPTTTTTTVEGSSDSSSLPFLGIRNDLVEIGGSFRSGLSLISTNKAVSEISKLASNLLRIEQEQLRDDDAETVKNEAFDEDHHTGVSDVYGINDEVLNLVNEIAVRPEFWINFPLSLNYDFNLSNAQKEHASTVLQLAPSLTALKRKLCSHMSNSQFWMIYFILLLPRLDGRGSELLSTPEVVEARAALLQQQPQSKSNNAEARDAQIEGSSSQQKGILADTVNVAKYAEIEEHKDTEQRLGKGAADMSTSVGAQRRLEIEEDVSFSDLEDDDDDLSGRSGSRPAKIIKAPSPSESGEWVQLKESTDRKVGRQKINPLISREKDSEDDSSNEWLTIDDFDSDSSRAA